MTTLPMLTLRGRTLLPIVQGGMGVGVSAHRLAGAVAREGALGTIASIDLRHHHADLLERCKASPDRATLEAANQEALAREIKAAKQLSEGRGMIAVNVMRAVSSYADSVKTACEAGADAIVMGAGLPLDLPDLTQGVDIALIPILSDSRGIALVLKKWLKKNRLPDAIVIEHPAHAGGHLGVANLGDMQDARFDFARVIEETMQTFDTLGIERTRIPLIVAGGINSHAAVRACLRGGRGGRATRHAVRGDRGRRRASELQAHPGRSGTRRHRRFRQRDGAAGARREDAVAHALSAQRGTHPRRRSARASKPVRPGSTASRCAGCATASKSSATSVSTRGSPPRCAAISRTACSFAAARRCRSDRRSAACVNCSTFCLPIASR